MQVIIAHGVCLVMRVRTELEAQIDQGCKVDEVIVHGSSGKRNKRGSPPLPPVMIPTPAISAMGTVPIIPLVCLSSLHLAETVPGYVGTWKAKHVPRCLCMYWVRWLRSRPSLSLYPTHHLAVPPTLSICQCQMPVTNRSTSCPLVFCPSYFLVVAVAVIILPSIHPFVSW